MSAARGPIYTPVELLARLVAYDTTSYKNNLGLIAFVEDYLLQHGVVSRRIVSDDGQKSSLYATIGPQKRRRRRPLGPYRRRTRRWANLDERSVHVASRKRQALRSRLGRHEELSGSFVSPPFLITRSRAAQETPIHLAFSYDEEIGCIGVRPMIAELGKELPKTAHGHRR